jgi:predicted MFS family arabinose efflux permease
MFSQFLKLSRTVHILCLGAFVNRAGTFLVPFLTLYLQKELGFDVKFATRAMGVFGVGTLLAYITGGQLADQIGRRVVMLVSLFSTAAILLVFGSLESGWTIMGVIFLFSFASEMYRPACSAMIADVTGPEQRTHAFGLMYVAINLGFAAATFVGGILAEYSFQLLFWGDALTAFIFAVIVLFTIRETLPLLKIDGAATDGVLPRKAEANGESNHVSILEAAKHILTNWTFIAVWFGGFCVAVTYIQAFTTFPLYLDALGIGAKPYGRLIALNGILIVVLQLPVTMAIIRYHRGTMMVISAVIVAVGFGLTGLAESRWHFALTIVVWTFGEIMHAPLLPAIVSDLAPANLRGRYMGVFTVCFACAMAVGAPLGGFVLDRWGGFGLWGGSLFVALLGAMLFAVVHSRIAVVPAAEAPEGEPLAG